MRVTRAALSLYVCGLLLTDTPAAYAAQAPDADIRIQTVAGQGAINNVARGSGFEPIIEVQDAKGRPISGATVTFTLPAVGPGGVFADGGRVLMVQSDENGRATARGLRPNRTLGQFEIRVNASYEGRTASTLVTQTNAAPADQGKSNTRKWAILLGVIGGAVAAGVIAAAGGGGSEPSGANPPVVTGSITPGAPGFGAPR
jgi:hypothetical protein